MHEEIRKAIERGVQWAEVGDLRSQCDGLKSAVNEWLEGLHARGLTADETYIFANNIVEGAYEQGQGGGGLSRDLTQLYIDEWYEEQVEE